MKLTELIREAWKLLSASHAAPLTRRKVETAARVHAYLCVHCASFNLKMKNIKCSGNVDVIEQICEN